VKSTSTQARQLNGVQPNHRRIGFPLEEFLLAVGQFDTPAYVAHHVVLEIAVEDDDSVVVGVQFQVPAAHGTSEVVRKQATHHLKSSEPRNAGLSAGRYHEYDLDVPLKAVLEVLLSKSRFEELANIIHSTAEDNNRLQSDISDY